MRVWRMHDPNNAFCSLPGTPPLQPCRGTRVLEAGLRCGAFAAPNVALDTSERVLYPLVACDEPRILARTRAIGGMGQGRCVRS